MGYLRRRAHYRKIDRVVRQQHAEPTPLPLPERRYVEGPDLSTFDVRMAWDGPRVRIETTSPFRSHQLALMRPKLGAALHWFHRAGRDVGPVTANLSDGDAPSLGMLSFSSATPGVGLVPDPYFFTSRGHAATRALADAGAVPWAERGPEIVWRGSLNGLGLWVETADTATNPLVNQRLRLAHAGRPLGLDVRFVETRNMPSPPFARAGLLADPQPTTAWLGRKFALDVDGFASTWDNLLHRMLFGCCVLRIESAGGFRQWYHDRLEPWVHYVPVRADLSDLAERVEWVRTDDAGAREIAEGGRAFARALDFETEAEVAGETVRAVAARAAPGALTGT